MCVNIYIMNNQVLLSKEIKNSLFCTNMFLHVVADPLSSKNEFCHQGAHVLSWSYDYVFLEFCYLQCAMSRVCNSATAFKNKRERYSLKSCLTAVTVFIYLSLKI